MNDIRIHEWIIKLDQKTHPRELMVETTMKCNYDCIHCFRRLLVKEELGEMDSRTFNKLIEQSVDVGVEKISFSGWGEPLVHPNIIDFIEEAKNNGIKILLNTNGSLLDHYGEELFKLGIDEIVVSMDAAEETIYASIRRGGHLALVVKGLKKINELKKKYSSTNPILKFQFTINTLNYKQLPKLVKLARELGVVEITVSNIIPLSEEHEKNLACYINCSDDSNEIEKLKHEISLLVLEKNVNVILPNFSLKTERLCPFIENSAAFIRWDGGVSPCIYYAHSWKPVLYGIRRDINAVVFGNINHNHLRDIWRSPEYVVFRFRAKFFHMPSCLDCPVQEYCILARSNDSDCWGGSPTCAHCPYSRDYVRCPL